MKRATDLTILYSKHTSVEIFFDEIQILPGIILLPASFSGRTSSPIPHRGPDPRCLISLAIFIRLQANTFKAPWSSTIASWADNASNLFGAVTKGYPKFKKQKLISCIV